MERVNDNKKMRNTYCTLNRYLNCKVEIPPLNS